MKQDAEIKQDVIQELKWDTRVNETEIGVSVTAGVVTLTGTVSSWGKKLAAGEAAHRVDGVHDVANDTPARVPAPDRLSLHRSGALAPMASKRATILVLDDDAAVLRAVAQLLASMGYHVLSAQSAGEAIALFEREYARIDLLVCDLVVSAIHGVDVAALLVRRMPRLRVLFMSAYADSRLDAARTLPTAEMIAKPFSMDELDAKVRRSLGVGAAGHRPPAQQPMVD